MDAAGVYEVEALLAKARDPNPTDTDMWYVLVHWAGDDLAQSTWEPLRRLHWTNIQGWQRLPELTPANDEEWNRMMDMVDELLGATSAYQAMAVAEVDMGILHSDEDYGSTDDDDNHESVIESDERQVENHPQRVQNPVLDAHQAGEAAYVQPNPLPNTPPPYVSPGFNNDVVPYQSDTQLEPYRYVTEELSARPLKRKESASDKPEDHRGRRLFVSLSQLAATIPRSVLVFKLPTIRDLLGSNYQPNTTWPPLAKLQGSAFPGDGELYRILSFLQEDRWLANTTAELVINVVKASEKFREDVCHAPVSYNQIRSTQVADRPTLSPVGFPESSENDEEVSGYSWTFVLDIGKGVNVPHWPETCVPTAEGKITTKAMRANSSLWDMVDIYPHTWQQPNYVDCGVYAIMEYLYLFLDGDQANLTSIGRDGKMQTKVPVPALDTGAAVSMRGWIYDLLSHCPSLVAKTRKADAEYNF
ncbi:uncharacterized protein EV422DRAFT_507165 [Fimicolochytrium jonesii]|uniref:uncharacterized protein n=1 Tax=Fimicolochytrium jonesii TaxID=1396493 RepID=UPI0022FEE42B|nr:uncharacterized protein EV422DRAFT_507165 [Fimicolochytrium jonesii]KAI8820018.1 hypothetical protein EV422DRAFT_507165 [Fimicolochytrium jonesii]